jgi:hypothetical protein
VRTTLAATVPLLLTQFTDAAACAKTTLRDEAMLQTDLAAAEDELDRTYEKIAGALVERVGKRAANRFFWRKARGAKKDEPPTA